MASRPRASEAAGDAGPTDIKDESTDIASRICNACPDVFRYCRSGASKDPSADKCHRFSLRFRNAETEAAFIQGRSTQLAHDMGIVWLIHVAFHLMNSLGGLIWFQNSWLSVDSSTTAYKVRFSGDILKVISILVLGLFLLCLRLPVMRWVGNTTREVGVGIMLVFLCLKTIMDHDRYQYAFFGEKIQDWTCGNGTLALVIDAYITVSHMCGVRLCVFIWADLACMLMFGFCCFYLEPKVPFIELITCLAICVGAIFSLRSREISERSLFLTVVTERTLRCEAEFQASNTMGQQQRLRARVPAHADDAASLPTTTFTGLMFESYRGSSNELEIIQQLGSQEHWLIDQTELDLNPNCILGQGGFATVVDAQFCGGPVAVKVPKFDPRRAGREYNCSLNELRLLRQVRHPNVVLFHGACVNLQTGEVLLVLERLYGLRLDNFRESQRPSADTASCIMQGVCRALMYLHSRSPCIVHCDLKPSNILVELPQRPKLLDFGLSHALTRQVKHTGGTSHYMAPEVLRSNRLKPSPGNDVFSLGRLLYFVASGRKPLGHLKPMQIRTMAFDRKVPDLDWLPKTELLVVWKPIIRDCISQDLAMRPTVKEVLGQLALLHPFEEDTFKPRALETGNAVGPGGQERGHDSDSSIAAGSKNDQNVAIIARDKISLAGTTSSSQCPIAL